MKPLSNALLHHWHRILGYIVFKLDVW